MLPRGRRQTHAPRKLLQTYISSFYGYRIEFIGIFSVFSKRECWNQCQTPFSFKNAQVVRLCLRNVRRKNYIYGTRKLMVEPNGYYCISRYVYYLNLVKRYMFFSRWKRIRMMFGWPNRSFLVEFFGRNFSTCNINTISKVFHRCRIAWLKKNIYVFKRANVW